MNILEKIVAYKRLEVEASKRAKPETQLTDMPYFERQGISMSRSLDGSSSGIISEHKRRSPSKSVINQTHGVNEVIAAYDLAGASAISVLTDTRFFGGSLHDLLLARSITELPLLRKEFVIDPYQLIEAKAYGADAVLLIAAVLEPGEIDTLAHQANDLGLEVLLEVHNAEELERAPADHVHMIGVNNRNLKTFEVSTATSEELIGSIPGHVTPISESGISDPDTVIKLRTKGYRGFLIGETFMKEASPQQALSNFIDALA